MLVVEACRVTITLLGPLHQMTATIQSAVTMSATIVTMSARIVTEYIYNSRAAAPLLLPAAADIIRMFADVC